ALEARNEDESDSYKFADVNQGTHKVTWTAQSDYLNIDIELGSKYKFNINNGNWDGMTIENMNDEGYYYSGETFNAAFKINLDNSDSTCTYRFTDTGVVYKDKDGNPDGQPTSMAVEAKKADGSDAASASEVSYFLVSGKMPAYDVYVELPIEKSYKMRLSNNVVADNISHKTMLTECSSSSSSATDSIGTITAVPKKGEVTSADISDDGTYYTYNLATGAANSTNNTADTVGVYTSYSNNKYLNGGVNVNGSDVVDGSEITYTFTFLGENSANYSFVGWFEGTYTKDSDTDHHFTVDYTKKLSGKTTYKHTPTKNTVVIAVATRDIYLGGNFDSDGKYTTTSANQTWASGRIQMTFDPTYVNPNDNSKKGRYYYKFEKLDTNNDTDKEFQFRAYDTVSGTDSTNLIAWKQWSGSSYGEDNEDILFSRKAYDGNSHGSFMFKTDTSSKSIGDSTKTSNQSHVANGYGMPVTVYFYAYDGGISVESTYQWSRAYVSNGVGVDCTNYEAATAASNPATPTYNTPSAVVSNKTVNDKDVTVTTQNTKYGHPAVNSTAARYEIIHECLVKENNGKIIVNASPCDPNLELDAFVCYNIDTKESWAVTDYSADTLTVKSVEYTSYKGNIEIPRNSKIYVVPVYKFTDAYIASAKLETHDVLVNTADINKNEWGGLVAMYSWGNVGNIGSGVWPGQLMVPSDDGKSFHAPLTFAEGALAGVTFDNYNPIEREGSTNYNCNFIGTYTAQSVSTTAYSATNWKTYQAYDYREPISIINNINSGYYEDDMTLTFSLKSGNKTTETIGNGAYNSSFNFEYLTDSSGKSRVDLDGNKIDGNPTETYRIVCRYTEGYYQAQGITPTETYEFASGTRNQYSIDWYLYDSQGNPVKDKDNNNIGSNMLSASFTDIDEDSLMTVIATALDDAGQPYKGKAVKIAYENPKTSYDTVNRYSGQWYNDSVNTKLDVDINIGVYADGVYTPSGSDNPGYAKGTIALVDGVSAIDGEVFNGGKATVVKKHAVNNQVKLSVDVADETFQGWFYYDEATGEYKYLNTKSKDFIPSFGTDMTYYAFYSAKATYQFEYTSRDGVTKKTYSVQGYDVTNDELADGGTLDVSARASDIADNLTANITSIKVFNKDLKYTLGTADTSKAYTIKYTANEPDINYTLKVYGYNNSDDLTQFGTVTGTFSTEVDLYKTALGAKPANTNMSNFKPKSNSNYVFVGWKKYNETTGKTVGGYLSTQPNFGYSLTEDMAIAPVFLAASDKTNAWTAGIDKNVITQELTSANTGLLYNDSIISFRNSALATSTPIDLSADGAECGIVILAQQGESAKDSTLSSNFSALGIENMKKYAQYFVTGAGKTARMGKMSVAKYGEAYAFGVKANSLSALNRVDLCQILDYADFTGGNYKVMSYYYDGTDYVYSDVVGSTYTPGDKKTIG
ncbi:MAG: hypothetical protein IJ725_03145, partial [Ruminococcus sp.]|nr:hypothetical protein [Ruminococcus sp.]